MMWKGWRRKQNPETAQLLSVFDSMDEPVYVADMQSHEVLYANQALKKTLGLDPIGAVCYQTLQGVDAPCSFCTNHLIQSLGRAPHTWQHYNARLEKTYRLTDRVIRWPDGRDVRLEIAIDITDQVRTMAALTNSERRYRRLFAESPAPQQEEDCSALKAYLEQLKQSGVEDLRSYFRSHPEEIHRCLNLIRLTAANQAALDLYGADSFEQRQREWETILGGAHEERIDYLLAIAHGESPFTIQMTNYDLSGRPLDIVLRGVVPTGHEQLWDRVLMVIFDRTAQRRAEEALRESEIKYSSLFHQSADGIYLHDLNGRILDANRAAVEQSGFSRDELLQRCAFDLHMEVSCREDVMRQWRDWPPEVTRTREHELRRKDGSLLPVEISMGKVMFGDRQYMLAMVRDLTERRQTEQALAEEHRHLALLMRATRTHFNVLDEELTLRQVDPSWQAVYGEHQGRKCYEYFMSRDTQCPSCSVAPALASQQTIVSEQYLPKERRFIEVHTIPFYTEDGEPLVAEFNIDITRRKQVEQTLHARLELMEFSASHTLSETVQQALDLVCDLTESPMGFYQFLEDGEKTISLQAWTSRTSHCHPSKKGASSTISVDELGTWADSIRTRAPTIHNAGDQPPPSWEGLPEEHPLIVRELVVPVLRNGEIVAVLGLGNASTDYTQDHVERAHYFADVTWEIAEHMRAEAAALETNQRFRELFESTVRSLARITELRDPYTAGHQRRVARLACAMADRLGIHGEQIEGLRVAALLHDIGKASVPTEILTKPGQLSPLEFQIIQEHPEVGRDILEDIGFPWPVAEIALQHHERLDGSGYPRALTREEILLEAQILAVADVVEAMSSHRPYRQALGIEAALAEIQASGGRAYDEDVVTACVELFAEGFVLDPAPSDNDRDN